MFEFPDTSPNQELEPLVQDSPPVGALEVAQKTQLVTGPISQEEIIKIISYTEQAFFEYGTIPTDEKVAQKLNTSVDRVRLAKTFEQYQEAMKARGIEMSMDILTPKQIVAANMICNLYDKSSIRQHLQALDVSPQQFGAWQRDPAFNGYLQKRMEMLYQNSDWRAYKALIQAIERGDMKAITTYFEMKGIYNPKLQVNVNIESYMAKVVEIIVKHVESQEVIEAIATEIEQLA